VSAAFPIATSRMIGTTDYFGSRRQACSCYIPLCAMVVVEGATVRIILAETPP